jgi:hypothetical protein
MPTSLNRWRLVQDEPIKPSLAHGFNELDAVDKFPDVPTCCPLNCSS